MAKEPEGESGIILYQTADGRTRVECGFENQNVWLTQALMAELFQTSVPNVNLHIKNILAEGELAEAATIKDYLIVRSEGGRQVQRPVNVAGFPLLRSFCRDGAADSR